MLATGRVVPQPRDQHSRRAECSGGAHAVEIGRERFRLRGGKTYFHCVLQSLRENLSAIALAFTGTSRLTNSTCSLKASARKSGGCPAIHVASRSASAPLCTARGFPASWCAKVTASATACSASSSIV